MKILFCPAHFRYTDKAGSEFYSSFNNAHRIASAYTDSVVIAGKSDVADVPYRIIETQKQKPDDWMKKIEDWSTLNSISFALSYFVAGYRLLRREKFDVIHHIRPFAVGTTFNFLPFFAPNTPFVIGAFASPYEKQFLVGEKKSKWSDHLFSLVLLIAAPALRQLSLRTLKRANAILVTDYETKALIAKSIPQEKIHVIPHGKDKRHFYLNPAKFEIPSINLLIVGNLIKRKRIDLAIHAFATAAKKNRNLFLHIAGDGLERSVLEKLVRDLHIEQRATFHGAIPFEK